MLGLHTLILHCTTLLKTQLFSLYSWFNNFYSNMNMICETLCIVFISITLYSQRSIKLFMYDLCFSVVNNFLRYVYFYDDQIFQCSKLDVRSKLHTFTLNSKVDQDPINTPQHTSVFKKKSIKINLFHKMQFVFSVSKPFTIYQ